MIFPATKYADSFSNQETRLLYEQNVADIINHLTFGKNYVINVFGSDWEVVINGRYIHLTDVDSNAKWAYIELQDYNDAKSNIHMSEIKNVSTSPSEPTNVDDINKLQVKDNNGNVINNYFPGRLPPLPNIDSGEVSNQAGFG
jgi:hypothetical protein